MTDDLRRALDAAYDVFARYPLPDIWDLSGNFQARDLSLERWFKLNEERDMGVLMYSDGGEVLRYFLPRWLDWLSDETVEFPGLDWELWSLSYRLVGANWRDWPTDEVAALRGVLLTWTREEIAGGGEPDLHFLNEAGEDLTPHLDLWLRSNLLSVARWLWTINWLSQQNERSWAVSSPLERRLETAFFANPDGQNAELFSRSIELVRSLRAL